MEKRFGSLSYQDIIAITRLSSYDARIFQQMLPDLLNQLEALSDNERYSLLLLIPRVWDTYFPLREAKDLAANLGNLLFRLQFYTEAILYYQKSILIYGKTEQVLYNMALCYGALNDSNAASCTIAELQAYNPNSELITELMETFEKPQ